MAEETQQELVERVMNKIEEFYFGDSEQSGEALFNEFAKKHETLFEGDDDGDMKEQKLEYTQVYNEFVKLFEELIEKLITDCGVDVGKFFEALKTIVDTDPDNKFYVEVLLSVTDYSNFIEMMSSYKRDQKAKKEE